MPERHHLRSHAELRRKSNLDPPKRLFYEFLNFLLLAAGAVVSLVGATMVYIPLGTEMAVLAFVGGMFATTVPCALIGLLTRIAFRTR